LHSVEIGSSQSPPQVCAPAHYSGVAARRINQNAIKWRQRCNLWRDMTACPIVAQNVRNYHTEARHVLLQLFQPLKVAIASHNHSKVFHELRDVAGLSAGAAAQESNLPRAFISKTVVRGLARLQGGRITLVAKR
jgi:hypothetical protein